MFVLSIHIPVFYAIGKQLLLSIILDNNRHS